MQRMPHMWKFAHTQGMPQRGDTDACTRPARAHALTQAHYSRRTSALAQPDTDTDTERAHAHMHPEDSCLLPTLVQGAPAHGTDTDAHVGKYPARAAWLREWQSLRTSAGLPYRRSLFCPPFGSGCCPCLIAGPATEHGGRVRGHVWQKTDSEVNTTATTPDHPRRESEVSSEKARLCPERAARGRPEVRIPVVRTPGD